MTSRVNLTPLLRLVLLASPPFSSVFPAPFLTDRRPSTNRTLRLPSSSANSQVYTASRRPSPPAHRVAHNCSSVGLSSGLHRQSRDAHAVYRSFRTFHISFHLICLLSPFYALIFILDFEYCRTLLSPSSPSHPTLSTWRPFKYFLLPSDIATLQLRRYAACRWQGHFRVLSLLPDHLTTIQVCSKATHHLARVFLLLSLSLACVICAPSLRQRHHHCCQPHTPSPLLSTSHAITLCVLINSKMQPRFLSIFITFLQSNPHVGQPMLYWLRCHGVWM